MLESLRPTIAALFSDADIVAPRYRPGQWESSGPDHIRAATWVLVVVPDDGIVGKGVWTETEFALKEKREVSLLHRGRVSNVCEMPFVRVEGGWWDCYGSLREG